MIKLFDVREPKSPPSPSSPHARHHTRSPEELRLQKDLSELELPPSIQLAFPAGKDHLQSFTITIHPDEGPYTGGAFLFAFSIPEGYPHDPPNVACLTKVFHPSIDTEGHVDLSTICEEWRPHKTIKTVLFGLNRLFLLPQTADPLNHQAAAMLEQDPAGFQAAVQQSVRSGATIAGTWFPPARGDKTVAARMES